MKSPELDALVDKPAKDGVILAEVLKHYFGFSWREAADMVNRNYAIFKARGNESALDTAKKIITAEAKANPVISVTALVQTLNGAISALQHGRRATAKKKVALVHAELNPRTSEIVFKDARELADFIDGMDGCGLITTNLDHVKAGIQARCFG